MKTVDAFIPGAGLALDALRSLNFRKGDPINQTVKPKSTISMAELSRRYGIPNIAEARQKLIDELPSTESACKLQESQGVVDANRIKNVAPFEFELTKAKSRIMDDDASRAAQSEFGYAIEATQIKLEERKREEISKQQKTKGELETRKQELDILDEELSETNADYLTSAHSIPLSKGLTWFYGALVILVIGLSFLFYGGLFDVGFRFDDNLLGRWQWARLFFGLFPPLIMFWVGYWMINSDWVGSLPSNYKIGLYVAVFVLEVVLVDGYLAYVGTQQKINQQHKQQKMEEAVASIKIPDVQVESSISAEASTSLPTMTVEKPLSISEIITDPLFLKSFGLGIMLTLLLMLVLPLVVRELMKRDSPGSLRAQLIRIKAKKKRILKDIKRLNALMITHAASIQEFVDENDYLGRLYNSVLHRPDHVRACLNSYTDGWISVVSTSHHYTANRESDLKFIISEWQKFQSDSVFTTDFEVE